MRVRVRERERMVERDPELLDDEALMDKQTNIGDDTCGRVPYALASFTNREKEREREKERQRMAERDPELLDNKALMDKQTYIGDYTCGRVPYAFATFTYRERERERERKRERERERERKTENG